MKSKIIITFLTAFLCILIINTAVSAQGATLRTLSLTTDSSRVPYTILIEDYEHGQGWYSRMPGDQGNAHARIRPGAAGPVAEMQADILETDPERQVVYRTLDGQYQPLTAAQTAGGASIDPASIGYGWEYILGVRVNFNRRGYNWFTARPPSSIFLEGEVKSFSVWVCGRNKRHTLYVMVKDIYQREHHIPMGELNFLGWQHMECQVPANLPQYDYRFADVRGLTFEGFIIKTDLEDSYGDYYIYFDNLSADLFRFREEGFSEYDPVDNW